MAVDVGSAYGAITIDTSAIERAVATAQSSLRGLDGINFGAGIGAGVATAANAVTGLQQSFAGLGTAGAAALSGLGTQLANLSTNTANGLGLASLGTQIDTIQAKVQSGFLTIKDNVTLAITAFNWADYITPLTWPVIANFAWGDYVSPLTWPTLPLFGWNSYVSPLTWPTLPSFGWNDYINSFTWPILPTFSWANLVPPFVWPALPSFSWGDFISRFSWPSLPSIPGFAAGGVAPGGLARVAERGAEVLRVPGGQGLAMATREMVLPLPAGTEIYNHVQSMAMLRELFGGNGNGSNGTDGANGTNGRGGLASTRSGLAAVTLASAVVASPITINATINNQADAEHLFRRIERLRERRSRGGDLRV